MKKLHALGACFALALAAPALAQTNAPITAAPAVTPTPTTGTRADRNDTSNTHLRNDCFDPATKTWSTRRDCLELIPGGAAGTTSPSPGPTIGGAATGTPDTTSSATPTTPAMPSPPVPVSPGGSPSASNPNPKTATGK